MSAAGYAFLGERIQRAEELRRSEGPLPIPHRYADVTVEAVERDLVADWRARGGDGFEDPLTSRVPLALAAFRGTDPKAKAGAVKILAVAWSRRHAPAALDRVSRHTAPCPSLAREVLRIEAGIAPLVGMVEAVAKDDADPEEVLVKLHAAAGSFGALLRRGAAALDTLRGPVGLALSAAQEYTAALAELERNLGEVLDIVPRPSPGLMRALEDVRRLPADAFERTRRPATVAAVKALVAAFEQQWWARHSEFPAGIAEPAPTPTAQEAKPAKRGGLLGRRRG